MERKDIFSDEFDVIEDLIKVHSEDTKLRTPKFVEITDYLLKCKAVVGFEVKFREMHLIGNIFTVKLEDKTEIVFLKITRRS